MKKIYLFVGGGVLLAAVAGIVISTMQPKSTQPTTSSGSPSPATNASSPTAVVSSPSTTTASPSPSTAAASPATTSPGSSPIANASPDGVPVAITPQTTSASNSIQLESCIISMVKVSDPNPPLNLRSTPDVKPDNIVGKLDNGTFLQVKAEKNGWFQVNSLNDQSLNGWISKKQTENSCNRKVARISLQVGGSPTSVSDRFIGTGSHHYQIKASKGQTLVLVVKSGSAPYLMDPNEKLIAGDGQGGGIDGTWTGKLPADGTYIVALDSNLRGYTYSFSVQLK